ncbi:MAG TPA: efflux RND transporter periplasmic adaptor subunit [Pirellulales bacterium]|jgi:RND family efflux transporter MFP subunit|nr:efflux RND transporter periplasmic adaptor subunit [Pirellulales bacterium]
MTRRRSNTAGAAVALLFVALMGAPGCGQKGTASRADVSADTPRPRVAVARPVRQSIRRTVTQPGQIEAFNQARLYAKIPAYVEKYHVDIGDVVSGPRFDDNGKLIERGQLLAKLFAPELDRQLGQKKALVAQAEADVEQAQAAIKVAQANVATAQAQLKETLAAIDRFQADFERWDSEYKRVTQLVSRSAVTPKLGEETKAQMLAADAARNEAQAKSEAFRAVLAASRAQLEKSVADEAAIRARCNSAKADEAGTEAMVDYLSIEAPFDGTVSERNADIGYFAQAGGANQAQPLFTVVRIDPVRVFIDVPEMDAPLVHVDDGAVVRVQSLAGESFTGGVTRTSWTLEPSTRTLHTEVDLPNADGKLRPGMYAQVTIVLVEHDDACTLPASAIVSQEDHAWCFVVEDSKAVRRAIALGIKAGGVVEIVSGLEGDELVVQEGGASLRDAQAVEIASAVAAK